MYSFYFISTYSSNKVKRFDGNGINILGINVTDKMTLVTISTNRIVHPQRNTGTMSAKQNNEKPYDEQKDGQTSTWEWLPSVVGIIAALGSICMTAFVLTIYKIRFKKSHCEAPENGTLIV